MRLIYTFSVAALLLSTGMLPLIIKFCKVYSLYDKTNARKIHSGSIPRLGGIAVALAFIICATLCFWLDAEIHLSSALPLLAAGMLIFAFGIVDDLIEMRALLKLIVQLTAAGIVVFNVYRFRQIFSFTLPTAVSIAFTFFWIIGIVNAYNLIDGLDGLCGGLSITTLITLGMIFIGSFTEGSAVCFILAAAIGGFLIFNWPPARIFMGDGGSQLLGFVIATVPLYSARADLEYNKFFIMLVVVSFPMLDTIAAIWRRLREHRSIMSPDRLHLHHKMINIGFTRVQVLYIVLFIQIIICMATYFSIFLERKGATLVLALSYIIMIFLFTIIHYANRAVVNKMNGSEMPTDAQKG